jgi:hypothetical protein
VNYFPKRFDKKIIGAVFLLFVFASQRTVL